MRICSVLRPAALFAILVFLSACSLSPSGRKQKYLSSGEQYFDSGKYSEASIQFVNAIKLDPNDADAHYRLGRTYVKIADWPHAYEEFKRVLELQPDNYAAHFDLAKLLIASGTLNLAQEETDLFLKKQPNDARGYFLAGSLLAAQANFPQAIAEMQKAIALNPSDWNSYFNLALMQMKNNQPDLAEASFKKAIEVNPKASDPYSMLGNFYQFRGQFGDAEREFNAAIQTDPQNPELRSAVARLYIAEGKKDQAEEFLKQVKRDFPANSAGYRMLGDFYFTNGDIVRATAEYASLFEAHPKDAEVENNYIQLLILSNRLDEARALNDSLLKKSPNDDKALLYSGQIQIRDGHASNALATLQKLVKNDPKNAAAHDQLGFAFQQLTDEESAEREWREAVRLHPELTDAQRALALLAMRKGDMTTLEQASTQLINLQPKAPEGYSLRAISEINRKQFSAAEADIHQAITAAPQSQLGYVEMGNLRLMQQRYADAASAYQQALDRDANSIDALRGLMNTSIAQNQADKAVALAETQIAKSPNNGDFYDLLGTTLFRNKHDLTAAESAFSKSAQLNPKNPDALIKLGQVQAAEGKVDEAISTYRQSAQDHPREISFYILLGDLYQSKQDWTGAQNSYQKALEVKPENPTASGKLAYVLLQSGQNLDVALSLAQTARRGLPESESVVDTLGWVYYQKGAYQSAINYFQEALKLERDSKSPDDPHVHYHLGMAYMKTGQSALARQQLQQALRMDSNSADAAEAKKQLAQLKS